MQTCKDMIASNFFLGDSTDSSKSSGFPPRVHLPWCSVVVHVPHLYLSASGIQARVSTFEVETRGQSR
ncbi:uncharacterized protein MELLADRAFT_95530 [Melampsora larici-populina 98AG31]|uniref:Uncharacterized protein n=1 Tax=Melampsora larici-populina (strain 98AG31 / pathotype 3-4-7) TaxID=747676 RepID=F4S9N6_MELLP|nr:uncharacterized protein MELLADRAFT_95530 [Melampsora larici-populina 98AG31]EGF98640.1 hypothetical protein MELLADRAFT_95530 [Melampsora larici-populina 98AG31]